MEILLHLIALSDVVLENFTPRVTRRFGLDYPSLRQVKPDLVLVSNTGYGHSGALERLRSDGLRPGTHPRLRGLHGVPGAGR